MPTTKALLRCLHAFHRQRPLHSRRPGLWIWRSHTRPLLLPNRGTDAAAAPGSLRLQRGPSTLHNWVTNQVLSWLHQSCYNYNQTHWKIMTSSHQSHTALPSIERSKHGTVLWWRELRKWTGTDPKIASVQWRRKVWHNRHAKSTCPAWNALAVMHSLVRGFNPSDKILVNWDDYVQYMKNNKSSKPTTSICHHQLSPRLLTYPRSLIVPHRCIQDKIYIYIKHMYVYIYIYHMYVYIYIQGKLQ